MFHVPTKLLVLQKCLLLIKLTFPFLLIKLVKKSEPLPMYRYNITFINLFLTNIIR